MILYADGNKYDFKVQKFVDDRYVTGWSGDLFPLPEWNEHHFQYEEDFQFFVKWVRHLANLPENERPEWMPSGRLLVSTELL